jgi:autotransporter-associated beta strand protein
VPILKPNYNFSILLIVGAMISLCSEINAQTREIFWGSHLGSEYLDQGDTTPGSIQSLFGLDAAGTNKASLVNGSADTSGDFTGDLIELGFFDTDGVDDSSYTPNTDTSNPFKGIWTPLTSKTTIGRDWAGSGADLVGAGEFYFKTKFTVTPSVDNESSINYGETFSFTDNLGDASVSNDVTARVTALEGASSALLGIRFYDIDTSDATAGGGGTTKATDGSTRYNTIMHTGAGTDWIWSSGFISLHNAGGTATDPDLVFEFDNSSANAASKVGTGDNAIVSDDFTATVTYFDGSSNINVGDAGIGSSVFSGFDGSGTIYGGQDANIVTLHSQSGNTGADAYEFSGDFYRAATGTDSTDLTILKTGAGDQILSGNLNLADSNNASASGGINLAEGKLILKPGANSQIVEYLEGSGTLVLDNTGASNNIVTLGFANNTASSFSGNVELAGSGTEVKISVSSGSTDDDYNNIQTISGVISGSEKLVKQGVGALKLNGTNSFDSDVEINGGRIIAASAQALGDTGNTIVINTGKLEVASGTTLNSGYTVQGDSDGSGRSFVGGDGTIGGSLTIGSANNEVDVIAPGEGLSTSINNDKKQAPRGHGGDSALAVGSFTVGTLTFNDGGVYDWEIDDFGGAAGTNWDLLNFTTLNLTDKTDTFTINVLGLDPTTDLSGSPNGDNLWSQGGTQWKFLEGTTINWGGGSQWSDAEIRSYFDVRFDDIAYQENMWGADWYVSYNSGAFYLQFSAVPEPSTYMMVTGLLMVPGMSYVRRFRKRKGSETVEEEPQI